MDTAELIDRFRHHPPRTPERIAQHETARAHISSVALALDDEVPDGREKALMFTKLEEALFWANAAIARQGEK